MSIPFVMAFVWGVAFLGLLLLVAWEAHVQQRERQINAMFARWERELEGMRDEV